MSGELFRVRKLAHALESQGIVGGESGVPDPAIVLGSGLADFGRRLGAARELDVTWIPEWPLPRVAGHGASIVRGDVAGLDVVCLTGRVHLYEGWAPADVVRPVRAFVRLGVPRLMLTNAAGGIADGLPEGGLLGIEDHINMTGRSALLGPHEEGLGPRFPDQTEVWSRALLEHLVKAARKRRIKLGRGVYAGVLGPSYETPAEVRMLRVLGVDAVGMSTVLEATAAHAMGAEVVGLSLVTNKAAGLRDKPLSHDEVVAAGEKGADRMARLVEEFCARLAKERGVERR